MAEHNELGKKGEQVAIEHLQKKGYLILEHNWRYQKCEVDIIAQKDNNLVFIEVKTRKTNFFGLPESFVGIRKIKHLAIAAENYCDINNKLTFDVRYDIISAVISKKNTEIHHFEDAFFPEMS